MRGRDVVWAWIVVIGFIGLWGTPSLAADTPTFVTSEDRAESPSRSETDKIQRSLQRLMDQANDGLSGSFRLDRVPGGADFLADVLTDDGFRVVVEAVRAETLVDLQRTIENLGGQVEGVARSRIQARLTRAMIERLAEGRDVRFIRMPMSPFPREPQLTIRSNNSGDEVRSEGLATIGTDVWHEIGLTGQGVRVGVIDSGFKGYDNLLGSELPEKHNVTARSFRSDDDIECTDCPEVNQFHGRATAEVVHDVAPRSPLLLSNFGTDVEFERTVEWMIEQDVDVINTSLGFTSGCFTEGGGIFEPVFEKAREAGITWVTSAGNEAASHWQGTFTDSDADDQHNFTDSDNTFTVEAELQEVTFSNGDRAAIAAFTFILSWNGDCTDASDDYNIAVFPAETPDQRGLGDWAWRPGVPIKVLSGAFRFDPEMAGERKTFQIVIDKTRPEAPDADLDLLIRSCLLCVEGEFDRLTPEGSVSILEPAISPNAFTVGAMHHDSAACGDFCPDGPLLLYSSRGPTKDGRTKPDIAAPTHVSTTVFGEWTGEGRGENPAFTGTSAASPHAAGAAALAQGAIPDADPGQIIDFLKRRAEDLGVPSADNLYGAGSLTLGPLPFDPQSLNVTGITPERAPAGQEVDAVITGTGLQNATRVVFEGAGINARIRDGATANELPVTLQISSGVDLGSRTFRVIGQNQRADSGRVALTVLGPPRFSVSTRELTYAVTVGDQSAERRTITVSNEGDGTLEWTARTTQSWITLDPASGTAPTEMTVRVLPDGLEPGLHRAQIVLEAEEVDNSPFRVNVVLSVQQPELTVDPRQLVFETTLGESPDGQTLQIRNGGAGTLRWNAVPQEDWIAVNASSGSGSFDLVVSIDAENLGPGTHRGSLRIEAPQATNSPVTVSVIVRVQGPEALVILEFERIEFDAPEDWRQMIGQVCVVYRNASDGYRAVHVTPLDDELETYHVPAGNDVVVCGNVVHIDTRAET